MEYTVQKLGKLAGISTRTLRYYDQIGLLKPSRINASGYRIYGQAEVDRLQQILFYRELGVNLKAIKRIMDASTFDSLKALKEHRRKLLDRKSQLEQLIANVDKTIAVAEGRMTMTNEEKFAGFKQKLLAENEQKYGREIREKYGEEAVEAANQAFQKMTPEEYANWERLGKEVLLTLKAAMATGDPAGELGQKTADLHRQWLTYAWGRYNKAAHAGLGRMYVEDPRFSAYYEQVQPGAATFLRDAILVYTGVRE
jgi:DNA-binding transcriptional MerR regulator